MSAEPKRAAWGLVCRRQILVPTWRGWILCLCVAGLVAWLGLRCLYPFLAVTDPCPGGVMVIEGWMPDYCLKEAMLESRRHHYDRVFVTGGPITEGVALSEYKTFPDLAAVVLFKLGMNTNELELVPAPPVPKDRTYTAAAALGQYWRLRHISATRVNLISVGPHARRSRLLFEKALGNRVRVGVIALTPHDFDPRRWWRSSEGFRNVTAEAIAYFYARLLFHGAEAKGLTE